MNISFLFCYEYVCIHRYVYIYICTHIYTKQITTCFLTLLSCNIRYRLYIIVFIIVNFTSQYFSCGISKIRDITQGLQLLFWGRDQCMFRCTHMVVSQEVELRSCYGLYLEIKYGLRRCIWCQVVKGVALWMVNFTCQPDQPTVIHVLG